MDFYIYLSKLLFSLFFLAYLAIPVVIVALIVRWAIHRKYGKLYSFSDFRKIPPLFLIIAAIIIGSTLIWFFSLVFKQVTEEEARQTCQQFYQQVEADINAISDYKVVSGNKECRPSQDEAGGIDYALALDYKVVKEDINSVDDLKAGIKQLSDELSKHNYHTSVGNPLNKDSSLNIICVRASKLLQEDGSFYVSGTSGYNVADHINRYTEPGSIPNSKGGCQTL